MISAPFAAPGGALGLLDIVPHDGLDQDSPA